jgi:hypothetical protein
MMTRVLGALCRTILVATLAIIASEPAIAQDNASAASDRRFRVITVGQHFSCGLTTDGEAFCWGANYYAQLGARSAPELAACSKRLDIESTCASLPVPVATTERFTDLRAGLKHVCAVGSDQRVWCWGRNEANQLGAAASDQCSPRASARGAEEYSPSACSFEPVMVESLPPSRLVAAGDDFSCALTADDGAVWCWGGSAGPRPRRISPEGQRFMTLSAGYTSVCADADVARVACWSLYGGVSETKWAAGTEGLWHVATSGHTCAIGVETNRVHCWGFNSDGSLGTGSHRPRERVDTPTVVAGEGRFVQVAVSFLGTCALGAASGGVWCWGSAPATPQPDRCASGSEFGGSHKCALTPQPVFPNNNFSAIAIAVSHGCAIAATTRVYCWGANDFGQLGNGLFGRGRDELQLVGAPVQDRWTVPFSAPSPSTLVLVGFVVVLGVLVARMLRSRSTAREP